MLEEGLELDCLGLLQSVILFAMHFRGKPILHGHFVSCMTAIALARLTAQVQSEPLAIDRFLAIHDHEG